MLEALKTEVCEIAKKAQQDGLCKHKSGNFSARDCQRGYVVMTPTGVDREVLTPEDMIVMDLNGKVLENLTNLCPTSEYMMHLGIYKKKPQTMAVVHTHSMYATTFAVLNKPIPAIVYEVSMLGLTQAHVPVTAYGRPGTKALAKQVEECCLKSDTFLLEKHGAIALDARNIKEAYLRASYLEELAELYYHTLQANGGREPDVFTQEELESWEYPAL